MAFAGRLGFPIGLQRGESSLHAAEDRGIAFREHLRSLDAGGLSVQLSISSVSEQAPAGALLFPEAHTLLLHTCLSCSHKGGCSDRGAEAEARPPSFPPSELQESLAGASPLLGSLGDSLEFRDCFPGSTPLWAAPKGSDPWTTVLWSNPGVVIAQTGSDIHAREFKTFDCGTLAFGNRFGEW